MRCCQVPLKERLSHNSSWLHLRQSSKRKSGRKAGFLLLTRPWDLQGRLKGLSAFVQKHRKERICPHGNSHSSRETPLRESRQPRRLRNGLVTQGASARTTSDKSWNGFTSNGTPLQHSCLENPMDRGAWWAAVHGVAKSQTWLSDFTFTFHFHALEKEMATHSSVFLPGESQGWGSPVGCRLWGHTELDTTEAT